MKLSILICTIISRKEKFLALYSSLHRQLGDVNVWDKVEILFLSDNKEISVGQKRQNLLEQAKGEYVVFIDDDDHVCNTYIASLLRAIKQNPDSIGFLIECNMQGKIEHAIASNKYEDWCDNRDGFNYCRTPYHKTPVRREIALKIGYKDMRFGEDYDYSKRLKQSGLIINELFINQTMYFYNYTYEDPKKKYGIL